MEHPPASTPLQVHDQLALTIMQTGDVQCSAMMGGDFNTSLPVTTSPIANINTPFQSYPFMPQFNDIHMDGGMKLHGLHDLHIARNSINTSSGAPYFFKPPKMVNVTRNTGGMHHHPMNDGNEHFVDSLMNQGVSNAGFQTPEADLKLNGLHDLHIARNSINANSGAPYFFKPPKMFDVTRNTGGMHHPINDGSEHFVDSLMNQGVSNGGFQTPVADMNFLQRRGNVAIMEEAKSKSLNTPLTAVYPNIGNVMPILEHSQSCTPKKIDGSFLTLGIGGNNTAQRSRSRFSTREIASKLEGPVSPHFKFSASHVRRNSSSLPTGGGGGPAMISASGGPTPNHFPFSPNALIVNQPHSSAKNSRSSDLAVKANSMYIPMGIAERIQRDRAPSTLAFCNTSSSNLGSTKLSDISLKSMSPQSSMYSCIPSDGGELVSQNLFGGGIPTARFNAFPQAPNIHGQPSLKRKAHELAPVYQRKRKSSRPMAYPVQIPRPPFHMPPPAHPLPHVKWQGDGPPRPTGHKCLLCKRDVALRPDGPVHQPSVPPVVAVLPCGHVFHDHCLHNVTPEGQSNDPPCIPCAIGET